MRGESVCRDGACDGYMIVDAVVCRKWLVVLGDKYAVDVFFFLSLWGTIQFQH